MTIIKLYRRLVQWIRKKLYKQLRKLRSKLRMDSLREAIAKADENKQKTGRKTIVVFNNHAGTYEALEKKLLKHVARRHQVNGQPAKTKYRKKYARGVKQGRFTDDRVKTLEKKSAYVAK
jgi:hypothetical protein